MAKSTSSSNLFAGFSSPITEKKATKKPEEPKVTVKEQLKENEEVSREKDIDALVQAEVKKILESKKQSEGTAKIGRPRKYDKPKAISVKLDSSAYDFVQQKGRLEFKGVTDYINYLVKKEMGE